MRTPFKPTPGSLQHNKPPHSKGQQRLQSRGIAQQALAMQWRPGEGKYAHGWIYPVYALDGSILARRWKAYDSAETPKYLWLEGKAPYYHGGAGLPSAIADAGGVLYIANGEPAVLTFHAAGLHNVLAFFGEGSVPDSLSDDLLALGVQTVRYYPDKDNAGHKAAIKLRDVLEDSGIGFDCRALPDDLPAKADTNDLWQHLGFDAEAYGAVLTDAPHYSLPAPSYARQRQPAPRPRKAPVHRGAEVDRDEERAYWWTQIVLPALDTAAPVETGRGKYRHCPNPAHPDKHPSFRISYDKAADGLPVCTCGVQDEHDPRGVVASWLGVPAFMDWWKAERAPLFARPDKARKASHQAAQNAIETSPHDASTLPNVAADIIVNLRYISDIPLETFAKPGVYLIRSELGTGKTELLKGLRDLWANKVLLGIDHRVTLTTELARRLDCESQLDLFAADQRLPSALITTLPSIVNQIDNRAGVLRPIQVVFLDEVEQVLVALFASTIGKCDRLRIYHTLATVIKRAEYVICLDADAGSVAYAFLKSIREDVTVIVNRYRNTDRPLQIHRSKAALQKALYQTLEADKGPIAVACSSDKFAAKLARLCAKRVGGADKVMLVTGKTKHEPAVREFLKNPDINAGHYRVIIYSSAMGSGVDISRTHAAAVFGFFDRRPLTAWDMHQMLMRFRNADRYNVWVDPTEAALPTDEQAIFQRLLDQEQGTKDAVLFDDDGIDQVKQERLRLARLQAAVTARENQSKRNVHAHFLALARQRYTVTNTSTSASPEEREQIRAELSAAGEEIAREQEQRILTATPVSHEQYKQCAIRGDLTPEIEAGHMRYQIEAVYAQEITPETIHDFDEGKGVGLIRLLESLYQPQKEAMIADRVELADRIPIGDLTHATKKRMLAIECLRLFVGPDNKLSADLMQDIDTINRHMGAFLEKYERDVHLYFGWRKDYSRKPLDLLRFMAGEVGLKIEEVNADRQRLYRERKALRKQGLSKEEAAARIPAPPKRYRLNRVALTKQERYIAQRRARALQDSVEEYSLSLPAKVAV